MGDHVVRPLRVHIQRVPAQANACVCQPVRPQPIGATQRNAAGQPDHGKSRSIPNAMRIDRAAHRAGRRWKWAQSASSKAGETVAAAAEERRRASTSLYTSRRRPCLSVRRPPAPASDCRRGCAGGGGLSTAMDLPRRTASCGRAASRSKSGAATREGRAAPAPAPTALAWKVVART